MSCKYVYSVDEENFYFDSEAEAVSDIVDTLYSELEVGHTVSVYRGELTPKVGGDMVSKFDIEPLLESIQETAYDEYGDCAEYLTYDISDEAKAGLLRLIKGWADTHLEIKFSGISNIQEVEVVLTKEMFESAE